MHIAIIADPLDKQKAGIHYLTKHLIDQFLSLKSTNKYSIICFNDQLIHDHRTIVLKNTVPFIKNDPIRTFITLPILLRKLNPDVVIEPAHFGPFNLPKKIKRVTIIHDLSPLKFPKFHPFLSQFLQRIFLPGIIKRADLLITNSMNTSKDLKTYYPKSKNKIEQIYLGKEDIFKPTKSNCELLKYGIQSPYILSVGTIEPRKNLTTLLKAFTIFKLKNPSKMQLVIVGSKGWKSKSFYKEFKHHPFKNDIKLVGFVNRNDLPILYTCSLTFIYSSLYEGFGLPVLEAMACGSPCIISNTSSLPEVGGEAALYFNPERADELSEKLKLIYDNKALRTLLTEKSIKQASRFSWQQYAKVFIQKLESNFGDLKGAKQKSE